MDAFISYMPPFETNGHFVPFLDETKKQIYYEWWLQKYILQTFCSPKILIYVIFAQHKNTYFSSEKLLFTKPCFLCLCSPPSFSPSSSPPSSSLSYIILPFLALPLSFFIPPFSPPSPLLNPAFFLLSWPIPIFQVKILSAMSDIYYGKVASPWALDVEDWKVDPQQVQGRTVHV